MNPENPLAVDLLGNAYTRVCGEKVELEKALEEIVNTLGLRCDLDPRERAALDAAIRLLQSLEGS